MDDLIGIHAVTVSAQRRRRRHEHMDRIDPGGDRDARVADIAAYMHRDPAGEAEADDPFHILARARADGRRRHFDDVDTEARKKLRNPDLVLRREITQ